MSSLFSNLSPRDRKILLWSTPVIVLLVVFLVAKNFTGEGRGGEAELDQALEDLAWLQTQVDAMAPLKKGCSPARWREQTVDQLAARHGLQVTRERSTRGEIALVVSSENGNKVIAFLQDIECHGASVINLSLETVEEQGAVEGRVVIQLPVT